ncbi:hypothetical protein SAMN05421690_102423 [Nitrosomonas sp. Nm51]|uniref:sulfite exporter TauE/SafE family protein n=1 Tax=Nitrosomonas sp. Nm51 TaxID=133720 RepID=UPI0008B6B0CF|nr:sulfite exporter TauE/SafE family protein [Nitrosomonas sp. Nm51]SER40399.1 hypothetical protein SAMN05421690_102423 [Nitrosomonas sp. Nm51]
MEWVIVSLAGFLGGVLNAVAGGGSFVTLPALIFIGVSPVSANTTGTAALLPGYMASAWRFRHDINYPAGLNLISIIWIAIFGGIAGATILLLTNEQLFFALIPWLILFATIAFIFGPWLLRRNTAIIKKPEDNLNFSKKRIVTTWSALFAVCIYGGYFNGGLGIILLAVLGLMGQTSLHSMNGIKNIISALLTTIAVVVYALGGTIIWSYLILMCIAAIAGGYFGAAFAYRLSQENIRCFIVLVGCLMSIAFFLR